MSKPRMFDSFRSKSSRSARYRIAAILGGVLLPCALSVPPAAAQLNTQHIKGPAGLKAASQPPPHFYLIAPLFYTYNTDEIRNRQGDLLPVNADITMVAYGVGFSHVTTRKFLGGFYGYQVLFAGINNRLQGTEIDANPGGGITDTLVQPIGLGWHFPRADVMAAYNVFVPTGRYTDGASDNTGLGMWGHEVVFGSTVYLNAARQYHASTLVNFDFQSKKEDSETKVGNTMILEGGAGGDFLRGGLSVGLAYYGAFKLSEDQIEGFPGVLVRGKNKAFALGPEVSLALASGGSLYGILKVNYQWELYARTTTQGGELTALLTLPLRPIKLP